MARKIKDDLKVSFTTEAVKGDPVAWLTAQAGQYEWLLAHAEDGVIWGRVEEGDELKLSGDFFPDVSPELRAETLQQARLFGEKAELLLWRTDDGWLARLAQDGAGAESRHYYDEAQVLWGSKRVASEGGFTHVTEGERGQAQAVPLLTQDGSRFTRNKRPYHPLRLTVRHYLKEEESGLLRVQVSRLVNLKLEEVKNEKNRSTEA
jgi:CRISPR-associated protein (TIGR03984 family)